MAAGQACAAIQSCISLESDFLVVTSDYFQTIDLLDIPLDNQPMLDGLSFRDVIESDSVYKRNRPIGVQSAFKNTFMTTWTDDRYKMVSKDHSETFELYDLVYDPYGKNDISSAFPD